jgi:hypothetical protein
MSFTANFTATQGADCSSFTLTDTSVYTSESTSTFSSRKVSIQKSDGSYLVLGGITYQNYELPFSYGNTLTLTGIDKDYSFYITLALTSTSPQSGSTYLKSNAVVLVCYTMSGFYTFSYQMAINPSLEKDYKFVKDLMKIWIEHESAQKSAEDADFQASQECLDRAKFIIDNLTIGY